MMAVRTIEQILTLVVMKCGECGIQFGVPEHFEYERRKTGKAWYCPNGHCRVYSESEVDKLQRELKRKQEDLNWYKGYSERSDERARKAERSLSATKGVVTRIKNRVKNGVCPCCNRTFTNLQRHMSSQHPDFMEHPTE